MENWKEMWDKRIADFAAKSGKTVEEVENVLVNELVGPASEEALGFLSDPSAVSDDDIKTKFAEAGFKMPIAVLKAGIDALRGPKAEHKEETSVAEGRIYGSDILPPVPDDESVISVLKTKGELKAGINDTDVISVCYAINADQMGFFGLIERILKEMERVAKKTRKPYSAAYYDLEDMLLLQTHAEVLKAMGLKNRRHVSSTKRKEFLKDSQKIIWPALNDFLRALKTWDDMEKEEGNDLRNVALIVKGRAVNDYPDPGIVYDAADSFKDKLSDVFIGPGIPNARCLAADAYDIKKAIVDERLPAALGVGSYEEMLDVLEASVMGDALRHEKNLIKIILGILALKNVTPGESERDYLKALYQVGRHIRIPKLSEESEKPKKNSGVVSDESSEFERY